jgi:heme/copper-type cytochrome/quinol oxidase subunit 2
MASEQISPTLQQRNPNTYKIHRRQIFWQIYFPLIFVALLVIGTIVLILLADNEQLSRGADTSLIFLIAITLVAFLIVIIGLVYAIGYLRRLLQASPPFFFNVQRITYIMEMRVKKFSGLAVEPILKINSLIAGARALRRK